MTFRHSPEEGGEKRKEKGKRKSQKNWRSESCSWIISENFFNQRLKKRFKK